MVEKIPTPFEAIGEEKLHQIVAAFYRRVQQHPDLAPIFPDDLTETARKQKQFLTQYLGGPNLYTREHGHPMLRARHLPFEITETRASAWLSCMNEAIDEARIDKHLKKNLYSRLALTAEHMINTREKEPMKDESK